MQRSVAVLLPHSCVSLAVADAQATTANDRYNRTPQVVGARRRRPPSVSEDALMAKPLYFFSRSSAYFELSNFYPCSFVVDGVNWPTVEHYFQAQKFPGEECAEHRERIRTAGSPQHAKKLGQSRAYPLRADWESAKEEIMLHALRCKFAQPKMRKILLRTKSRQLVEDSPFDSYWGRGRNGKGKNRLGVLLMQVRDELRGTS